MMMMNDDVRERILSIRQLKFDCFVVRNVLCCVLVAMVSISDL